MVRDIRTIRADEHERELRDACSGRALQCVSAWVQSWLTRVTKTLRVLTNLHGRQVFWATQLWYTHDHANSSICTECCNGINPSSLVFAPATELCGCTNGSALVWRPPESPLIYDLTTDPGELAPLSPSAWPVGTGTSWASVAAAALVARDQMHREANANPTPDHNGAGNCTEGAVACASFIVVLAMYRSDL